MSRAPLIPDEDPLSVGDYSLAGRPMTRTEWDEYLPGIPYRDVCSEAP